MASFSTSQYDSHKRADFNFRSETLDSVTTTTYIPRPNKMQTNEHALDVPRLPRPHAISRCEFPVHPALDSKPRWDPSTGDGGDPYGAEKANRAVLEKERIEALAHSKRHPPKNHRESLIQREERFLQEKREAKLASRSKSIAAVEMFRFGSTLGSGGNAHPATLRFGETISEDNAHMLYQVPVKQVTTWNLGGF